MATLADLGQDIGQQLGAALMDILMSDGIEPGSEPSYQLCKAIYTNHPQGGKLAEKPVAIAMSAPREITVQKSPGDHVVNKFKEQWQKDGASEIIKTLGTMARVYGVCSLAMLVKDVPSDQSIDPWELADLDIAFNIVDPLNTAGSLVLDQNPNSLTFLKHVSVSINGMGYHRSRTVTLMNERPVYLAYTNSAFGYVGRSVYQRALFPLKTFIRTMITDDMVARKAGLLIAKQKAPGSIINQAMQAIAGVKRVMLQQGGTNNVLSIGVEEAVETLNMQNLEGPAAMARRNALENIAAADNMPAKMMTEESLSSSFNEGTEEARVILQYVDAKREWLQPAFDFLDPIIMHRAWTPEFFETMKILYPEEYGARDYKSVFFEWKNSFEAVWPSLIKEPDSEKINVSKVRMDEALAFAQVALPHLDPENKAKLFEWLADNANSDELLFPNHLQYDADAMASYIPTQPELAADEESEQAGVRSDAQVLALPPRR